MLFSHTATAASVYWQPHVQVGGGRDSNPRLVYDIPGQDLDAEASALYQSQIDGELGVDGGATKSTVYGRYWYQSVAENHDCDADIAQLRGNFTHTTERSMLTADVDAQYDTTLTSEFEESGISPNEKKDHKNLRGSLGYRWQLTELDQFDIKTSGSSARYINAESTDLNDYDTMEYNASYARSMTERVHLGFQLAYSEFDIPWLQRTSPFSPESYRTDNYVAALFGDYAMTERDSLSFQLGARANNFYSEFDNYFIKQEGNGRVFSAEYQHTSERSKFTISAARDVRPTSAGRIVEQDSIDMSARFALDERMSISTSLSVNREREPVQQGGSNRDYAQGMLSMLYNVSEQHTLALELLERWQQYRGEDDVEAESTGIFLRWYWTPLQYNWH